MNIQEYDVMNAIIDKGYHNQRTLSESTGYSLGKVNQSLAALVKDGYLNKEYTLTDQGSGGNTAEEAKERHYPGGWIRGAHGPHQP